MNHNHYSYYLSFFKKTNFLKNLYKTVPKPINGVFLDRGLNGLNIESNFFSFFSLFLNKHVRFNSFIDLTAVDYPEKALRFELVLLLRKLLVPFLSKNFELLRPKNFNQFLILKLNFQASELTPVPSISNVFLASDWAEREIWDLFGLFFLGHKDLRRLLTDYGFQGHPFRKDFPLTGYLELRYDSSKQRVVYEPIQLTQEFRLFDFLSPWSQTHN